MIGASRSEHQTSHLYEKIAVCMSPYIVNVFIVSVRIALHA